MGRKVAFLLVYVAEKNKKNQGIIFNSSFFMLQLNGS